MSRVIEAFRDTMHKNTGTHLTGGILDDGLWQTIYTKLLGIPIRRYCLPNGAVGKCFINMLTNKLKGVRTGCWNSEKILAFPIVILQQKGHITGSKDVCKCISIRMNAWDRDEFDSLVNDTIAVAQENMGQMQHGNDDAH